MRSFHAGTLALAVLVFAAVIAACGDDDSEDVSDGTPTLTPGTPIPLETFVPFEGRLGDFLIAPDEANEIVCEDATISQMASELAEAFPDREIIESTCSAAASLETGALLTRFAYTGELRVGFSAPRDRLELVTVSGRPGIVAHPPVQQLPSRAIILEREPDGEPGVFIELSLSPDTGGIDEGLDFVEQFLER